MEAFLVSTMVVGLAEIGDKTQILSSRIQLSSSGTYADARDCIMVRIQTDLPHTSLVARSCAPMANSPRINTPDQRCPTPPLKKPVSGHHRSACSGVKPLRNTSDAKRQAAKLR
jgi:hypothetical protein